MTEPDVAGWSGDGDFTRRLLDVLQGMDALLLLRVEDAPASRAETGYNFISNEIYVGFARRTRREVRRLAGLIPVVRHLEEPVMTLGGLEAALSANDQIGAPDYSDENLLQYLRTERIIPPYQTRGYKLVELVRIYETR